MITVFFIDPNDLTPQLNYPLLESLDQKEELDIRYFTSVNRYASEYYTKHYKVKKKIVFFRLANKIKNNGLRRLVKALSYPFNSLELIFHVFRKKPDILHYSSIDIPFIDFFILGLFRLFRFKIILTKHNYIEHESKKLGFFRYQILKLVDNIVVLSGYTKSLFDRKFDDKITLIGHGNCYNKEIELFGKNKTRKEKESFTVLYIGIIRKYKGIDDLIEAINQIVNQWKYQDIQFRIYGNCHQNIDQEILRKIKEYDLEEYVDFKNLFVPYDELIENIVDCD